MTGICRECKAELATREFARLPVCQMCWDRLVAIYNSIPQVWHDPKFQAAMVLQAKDLVASGLQEADL